MGLTISKAYVIFKRNLILETSSSMLGFFWIFFPIIFVSFFYIFIRTITNADTIEYDELFVTFIGINVVFLITDSLKRFSSLITSNILILKTIFLDYKILILSEFFHFLFNFSVRLILSIFLILYFKINVNIDFFSLILNIFYIFFFVGFFGLLFSVIAVVYSDIEKIIGYISLPFIFLSPIFYKIKTESVIFNCFDMLNPVSNIIYLFDQQNIYLNSNTIFYIAVTFIFFILTIISFKKFLKLIFEYV